jgi:cobalt-zinc-cadmium efflux system membrane fusion protein
VRSEIPNPDGVLKAEMFATFRIVASTQNTLAVPIEAVIRESDVANVWVGQEGDPLLFKRRKVTIGMEQDGRIEIREGLTAGEWVVTRGAIFIDNEARQ